MNNVKSSFLIAFLVIAFMLVGNVQAVPTAPGDPSTPNSPSAPNKPFALPNDAVRISEDTFKLRPAKDSSTGETVEAFAIVHKANFKKTAARALRPLKTSTASTCYGYLASGAKWKWVEPWVVNPANNSSIPDNTVFNIFSSAVAKWEDATDGVIGNGLGVNVLGDGSTTSSALLADTVTPDNMNEAYFGAIEESNTIAVTIVWGVFGGPTWNRRLVEWDQIYNTAYNWSSTGDANKMDLDNIITHEKGHSFGMNDLYTSYCSEQTMFGWAAFGETKKSSLEIGDINGINKLY